MSEERTIAEELQKIHERNARVTADKVWETSFTRRASIALLTYVTVVIVLMISKAEHPFLGAVVPPIGYMLSTLSLSKIKAWWLKKRYDKK